MAFLKRTDVCAIDDIDTTYTLCTATAGGGQHAGEMVPMG